MTKSKKMNKFIAMILSVAMIMTSGTFVFAGTPSTNSPNQDTSDSGFLGDRVGFVELSIEDTLPVPEGNDWPAAKGMIIDTLEVPIYENDNIISVIERTCGEKDITIDFNSDKTYISGIDGLSEMDKGPASGWMATLNDWFTDTGLANYTCKDKTLNDGDRIEVKYTINGGKDLGNDFNGKDNRLKSVTIEGGTLDKDFNSDEYSYTIKDADSKVKLNSTAINKKFKVEEYLNGEKVNKYDSISVKNGDVITIKSGLKDSWKEYSFKVEAKPEKEPVPDKYDKVNVTLNIAGDICDPYIIHLVNDKTDEVEYVLDVLDESNPNQRVKTMYGEEKFGEWNIELEPGSYRFVYLGEPNWDTPMSSMKDPKNCPHFTINGQEENQTLTIIEALICKQNEDVVVRDADGNEISPTLYREKSSANCFTLISYGEDINFTATVRLKDRNKLLSLEEWGVEVKNCKVEVSKDQKSAEVVINNENFTAESINNTSGPVFYDKGGLVTVRLVAVEDLNPNEIIIPKDLPNCQIYEKNTKAYTPFNPIENRKGVKNYKRENIDDKYDRISFEGDGKNLVIIGGGWYTDEHGELKDSGYIKSFMTAELEAGHRSEYFIPSKVGSGGKNNFEYNDHAGFASAAYPYNDILTNLKDEGMYQTMASGETVELNTFRTEQGIVGVTSNTILEPDKQYQVYGDTVELSDTKGAEGNKWVEVTGKKDGTSIVAIAYEPTESLRPKYENGNKVADNEGEYGPAIDPENIGIAIYDVNGRGDTIDPGIDLLKYDTIYFNKSVTGPSGEKLGGQESKAYTFTPKSKAGIKSVEYHTPIASMDDFNNEHFFDDNTWEKAKADGDKYTVQLRTGRNIIKITAKDGAVRYFTIRAKGIDVTAEKIDGTEGPLKKGDTLRVSFSNLKLPVPKLSAIYNPGFPDRTFLIGNANGKPIEGPHTQYVLFAFNYFDIEIDDEESIDLSDIRIHADHMGSALDSHCEVDKDGLPPDFNAENKGGIYCYFDDISIPVEGNKGQEVTSKYQDKYNETAANYVKHNLKFGTEWPVIGLARGGYDVDKSFYDNYYNDVVKTVKEKKGELSTRKYTEYSRTILALTAAGYDPTDVGGYNLVDKLGEFDNVKAQGLNGPIWALIALNSHEFDSEADTKANTDKLLETVLAGEVKGGGWTLMEGDPADIDMTAMAIQSLAPYYNNNETVKAAVDRGLDFLSKKQDKNGGYMNAYEETSSESISQVIVALTSLGIDPQKDERFIKNGNNMLDALCDFYAGNGMFKHTLDGKADGMATEQALYALASYIRFEKDMTPLYDMSDVKFGEEPIVTPDVPEKPDTPDTPSKPVKPTVDKDGNGTISSDKTTVNVSPSEIKNLSNRLDVIISGNAKITYDKEALEEIKKQLPDDAVNIEFVLEKTEKGVNDKQKATIDASKALDVFRIEIVVTRADGSKFRIHDFGEGRVNVSIAFANPDKLKLEVHRVENDGKITLMNSTYSEGILSWVTDGHSYYMVTEAGTAKAATGKTTPKTGDTNNMMPWLIVLMGAAGTVALIKRKKER